MIVPLPLALLLGFLVGVAFAWAARSELQSDEGALIRSRPVVVAALFAAFVVAPIEAYFTAFHGDWAYLYGVDWRKVPSAVDLVLVVVTAAVVPLGTLIASPAARARRLGTVVQLAAGPLVVFFGLVMWAGRRLRVSGTFAEFQGDFGTEAIVSSALGQGVLWMAIVGALGVAWSVRSLSPRSPDR